MKALRLYEQRGLLAPLRTAAGWRTYGPVEIARAGEIAALRALGLSLAQVARVLGGDAACLDAALAAHQTVLEGELQPACRHHREGARLARRPRRRRGAGCRSACAAGATGPRARSHSRCPGRGAAKGSCCCDTRALNYVVGPLGSGKTRLARAIAEALPDAAFLGLEQVG